MRVAPHVLLLFLMGCHPSGDVDVTSTPKSDPEPNFVVDEKIIGIANLDDDDQNGKRDWGDKKVDDDLAPLQIFANGEIVVEAAYSLQSAGDIRVWYDDAVVLDGETTTVQIPWEGQESTLYIELAGFLVEGELLVELFDDNG
ncbi:MAG: hypothetical protein HN348_04735, partial [Proteobacteria bacterium]|nr:hypothetical protein [Pseudomonadota bacterium]